MILSTIANHSLPFTMAPVIFDVARELAKDPKALSGNTMDRKSASIKIRFGLAKTIHKRTITHMQNGHFSLNIDKSTSNNLHILLALLVSYYSPSLIEIIVEHLTSISVEYVTAKSLYDEIVNIFSNHELPWQNLMSILMDSCAVMRGSKRGIETRTEGGTHSTLFFLSVVYSDVSKILTVTSIHLSYSIFFSRMNPSNKNLMIKRGGESTQGREGCCQGSRQCGEAS